MDLFLWMPHLVPMMWSTTYSHWWHLIFIKQGCQLLGLSQVDKHVKIWWSGWMPCGQSFFRICQIGDHHVSLWMMPHKNFEHCGRLYIDFYFFCCIVFYSGTTLAWGFHNIFILHGKCHGKHINIGSTMARLCEVKIMSQFFFAHGMCWKHGTCIPWKKSRIQRLGVLYLIASMWWCSCPSTQMKPLMISRRMGRRWWWKVLITYNLVLLGQDTFGLIIANYINKWSPLQVWHNLKPFCYGCMFTFHT